MELGWDNVGTDMIVGESSSCLVKDSESGPRCARSNVSTRHKDEAGIRLAVPPAGHHNSEGQQIRLPGDLRTEGETCM
jgi:hypothetical protein